MELKTIIQVILFLLIAILLITLFSYGIIHFDLISSLGDLGSYIGGIGGTILTAITVFLVYKTYKLQGSELELSRRELSLTRNELELTRNQITIQNFEVTFFNLLQMLFKIAEAIKSSNGSERDLFKTGVDTMKQVYYCRKDSSMSFDIILEIATTLESLSPTEIVQESESSRREFLRINEHIQNRIIAKWKSKYPDDLFLIQIIYSHIHNRIFEKRLSQYFGYINSIVTFIVSTFPSESEFDEGSKQKYSRILQSQLSSYELVLLLYHGIISTTNSVEASDSSFVEYIKKYRLVENVDETLILHTKHYNNFVS